MVSLMENKLPPLKDHANVPDDLDRFVTKALRKNQKERYQTAGQLARDLKSLKQKLQVDSGLNQWLKTVPSRKGDVQIPPLAPVNTRSGTHRIPLGKGSATETTTIESHPTSSAEYLVSEITLHKRGVMLTAAALLIAVVVAGYLYVTRSRFATAAEPIDSVAVLPFVNVANDPNAEYLADGISNSIIGSLSQLPNLKKVSAFNSVLRYKGKQTEPQTVGRELNVRAVLTGRLTLSGDELLVSTELVDVRDNKRLWGSQYNRKSADVQKLQGEIAQEIGAALRLKLSGEEQQRLAKSSNSNPEAYELYLRGRLYQRDRAGAPGQARDYLEQAIKKDPNYAPAYAQLAYTYVGAVLSDSSNRTEALE